MTEPTCRMESSNAACITAMEPQSTSCNPLNPSPSVSTQSDRGNFRRISRSEDGSLYPIPGLAADALHMRVKEGSKIRNLLQFATTRMQRDGGDSNGLRQVVFTGSDRGITKTVTCVEILKRKVVGLHQVSKIYYKRVTEVWESTQLGLPGTATQRTVPAICILLSKDPLDPQEPGYQPPQTVSEDTEGQRAQMRLAHTFSPKHRAKKLCQDDLSAWTPNNVRLNL